MKRLLPNAIVVVATLAVATSLHAEKEPFAASVPERGPKMHLFMDTHRNMRGITPEGIAAGHQRDLAVQDKHGAKFIEYWYNKDEGTVFCLREGADAEACQATHREAHGAPADAIVEVQGPQMTSLADANKALLRRMVDQVLNAKNLDLIPELMAENYIDHNAAAGQQQGIKVFIEARVRRNTAFPDWQVTLDDVMAEGDKVMARATGRGTHRGTFMGIAPTGNSITSTWIVIYRVVDGKLAEHWLNSDDLGTLRQLGALR